MTAPTRMPRAVPQTGMSTTDQYRQTIEHLAVERLHDLSATELQRINATLAMIPSDVGSVLDVGCGDGRLLGRLPTRIRGVGIDYSYHACGGLTGRVLCASSEHLPFPDESFDLVLCCEVLEHLPDKMFRRTLAELDRVSRQYILLSVPYKENLRLGLTRCQNCGTVFHIWGHVRRFTNAALHRIVHGFEATSTRYVGKREPYCLGLVSSINQACGGRWAGWDRTTICPHCGNTSFRPTPRNFVTIACGLIDLLTSRVVPVSRRHWILTLYRRHGSPRK